MTLKELVMKVEFDALFPYLKRIDSKRVDNWCYFREAYDILRSMEASVGGEALVEYNDEVACNGESESSTHKITVHWLDDNEWDVELGKELIIADGVEISDEELAAYCLWEITYYGFSPEQISSTIETWGHRSKPQNKYEIAFDKLEESIWRRQTPRKQRVLLSDGTRGVALEYSDLILGKRKMNRSKRKR